MLSSRRFAGQTLVPALLTFVPLGCATTIAGEFPHLERRKICVHLPEDPEASEYLLTKDGAILSDFQRERVRLAAPSARTVFEFDLEADPSSVRHLPPRYQDLECAPAFSMLPAIHKDTSSLPEAAVDVLVHEQRPDPVPKVIANQLARCGSLNSTELDADQYTMTINVFVQEDGQSTAALVVKSTLGDRAVEGCVADVLRNAQWPSVAAHLAAASEPGLRGTFAGLGPVAAPPGVKSFFGEPALAPNQPPPPAGDRPSGVYRVQPAPGPPGGGGSRIPPGVFVLPLSPGAVAILVFGTVVFWPSTSAPGCATEMNPETGKPYTSPQEYDEVQGRRAQRLKKLPRLNTEAIQSRFAPKPAPTPTPTAPPATGTRRNPGQTCEDEELDRLEAEKEPLCKPPGGFAVSCKGDLTKPKFDKIPCSLVKLSIQQRQTCLAARWDVQNKCFGGKPDSGHQDQIDQVQNGIDNCELLKLKVCAPGHPMAKL